ncbi:MAG: 3-dehydroquinate dehydratase [Elusimicrobiota bacterium]
MRKKILIIHGPNLHLLGKREPEIYGKLSLKEVNKKLKSYAKSKNVLIKIYQSNYEGEIIDLITKQMNWADFIIINPAAFTHYSYAIRDCIKACGIPTIEVHLSDINKREKFRRKSVVKDVCIKTFLGEGINSYLKAIDFCLKINTDDEK